MMNALGMISSCTGNLTEIKFLNRIVVTREKKKKKNRSLGLLSTNNSKRSI